MSNLPPHRCQNILFKNTALKLSLPCLKCFDVNFEIKFKLLSTAWMLTSSSDTLSHTQVSNPNVIVFLPVSLFLLFQPFPIIVTSTYTSSLIFHWKNSVRMKYFLLCFFSLLSSSSPLPPPPPSSYFTLPSSNSSSFFSFLFSLSPTFPFSLSV